MRLAAALVLLLLPVSTLLAGEPDERPVLAIPDLEVRGPLQEEEPEIGELVADLLAADLSEAFRIVDRSDVRKANLDVSALLDSSPTSSEAGKRLVAAYLLVGRISTLGGTVVVQARLFDVGKGRFVRMTYVACDEIEDIPEVLEDLLRRLDVLDGAENAELLQKLGECRAIIERLTEENEKLELMVKACFEKLEKCHPGDLFPPPIDAVVTAVSDETKVVTLSVGRDDGVRPGMEFTVYRGDMYVAKVVVQEVEKAHCSGTSRKGVEKCPILAGDRATTRF